MVNGILTRRSFLMTVPLIGAAALTLPDTLDAQQPKTSRYIYPNGDARYHSLYPEDPRSLAQDGWFNHDIPYSALASTGSILYIRQARVVICGPQKPGYGMAFVAIENPADETEFWHMLCEVGEGGEGQRTENFTPPTPMLASHALCLQCQWRARPGAPSIYGWSDTSVTRYVRLELEYHIG